MDTLSNHLATKVGIDAGVADDVIRWGDSSKDSISDRFFWMWAVSRITATPVGRAYLAGAAAISPDMSEIDRLSFAAGLLKSAVREAINEYGSAPKPEADPAANVRDKAVGQLMNAVSLHFDTTLVRERARLFRMGNGQKVRFMMSKPHRQTGEAYVKLTPDHFDADWIVAATIGLSHGWIIPAEVPREFFAKVGYSSTHQGRSWWNVFLAKEKGADRMWVTKKAMLDIRDYRQEFGQPIGI